MNKLTTTQLSALSQLGDHPSIAFVDLSFHQSGFTHIMVSSKPGASLNEISSELSTIFPDMLRSNIPEMANGVAIYTASVGHGLYCNIHMNGGMADALTSTNEEFIQLNFTTLDAVMEETA